MYNKYIANRAKLTEEAENLVKEGKYTEANAKAKEIEALDKSYDEGVTAQANLNSLKDNTRVPNMIAGQEPNEANEPTSAEAENAIYTEAWAKDMQKKPLTAQEQAIFNKVNDEFKNVTQGTDTQGIVVPTTVAQGIWAEVNASSPILAELASTFIAGTFTIIKEDVTGNDADWVEEHKTHSDSEFKLGELNLTGCELVKAITVSWKLRKMSIKEFIPYIQNLLAQKMKRALATGVVVGKGKAKDGDTHTDQPIGIITAIEAEEATPQKVVYTTTLTYKDITSMMAKAKLGASGAKFFANSTTIWNQLANIVDGAGRPIFIADSIVGGVGRMFGKIVAEEETMADDVLLLGNVKEGYKVNVNQDITLLSEEMNRDRATEYMAYAIVDGAPIDNRYFVVATKAPARAKKDL